VAAWSDETVQRLRRPIRMASAGCGPGLVWLDLLAVVDTGHIESVQAAELGAEPVDVCHPRVIVVGRDRLPPLGDAGLYQRIEFPPGPSRMRPTSSSLNVRTPGQTWFHSCYGLLDR